MKSTNVKVLFVEYSLAPEYPFPRGLEDNKAVYEAIIKNKLPKDIILIGDSAGGQQATALMLEMNKKKMPLPKAFIGLSPAFDISPDVLARDIEKIDGKDPILNNADEINPFLALYYQNHNPKDPRISPIYGDLNGLPPMLIFVSSDEALIFQCREFAAKATKAGIEITLTEYQEMMHVWMFYNPTLPESQKAFGEIGQFVKRQFNIL